MSTRILVGILSALDYEERRQACRETWLSEMPDSVDYIFGVGLELLRPWQVDGDVLGLPGPDDYGGLPQKVKDLCRWFLGKDIKYLFKCDDDTYVRLDRLAKIPKGLDYCGGRVSRDRPYLSGGAGYLLSRKAARAIVQSGMDPIGAEDRLVGEVLAAVGIEPVFDPRFCWNEAKVPLPHNEVISTHYCSPDRLRELHRLNWS